MSLNQYIVFALTRQVTQAFTVQPVPEAAVREQRAAYAALLQCLGPAPASEIERALTGRARVEPEAGLAPEIVSALQDRIARRRG